MTLDATLNADKGKSLTYSFDDAYFQNLVADLTLYGLTLNQAKLYLHLLNNGPVAAKEVSKALDIHRVDVYRRLRELEELGIIEVYLDFPKKFAATDPRTTLESLIKKAKSRVSALEDSRIELQKKLDEVSKSARLRNSPALFVNQEGYYKFSRGSTQYFTEIARLFQNAKYEILKISSANGLKRAIAMGLYRHYKRAYKRGVKVRLITAITAENVRYARMFAKVTDIRHIDDVHFRFTIADRSVVLLSARYDDKVILPASGSDIYFLFNDPMFASALCFLFEHLWDGAQAFDERLNALKTESVSTKKD